MKRSIASKNVILAFVLAALVFIVGMYFGNFVVSQKYDYIQTLASDLRVQTMSLEVQYALVATEPCRATNASFLVDELSQLNSRLDHLEQLYGTKDPEILQLKQYYSILQIRHWMLFKEANRMCDDDSELILYFYSNEGCEECQPQGSVLTAYRKKYRDTVKVYAFDIDLDDPALKTLKEIYGVTDSPTIIYNDEIHPYFVSFSEFEDMHAVYVSASETISETDSSS